MMNEVKKMNEILKSFKINASCEDFKNVDNYSFYDIALGASGKIKDITKYLEEISLALRAPSKPSLKVIREKGIIRLEFIKNSKPNLNMLDYVDNDLPKGGLQCLLGRSVVGEKVYMDLAANPHLLVAGTTGSGKSVFLNALIFNLIYHHKVKLFLMDPKNIEFSKYDGAFDNVSVSYTFDQCANIIDNLVDIMNSRYMLMKNGADINKMPYVVVILDEFSELVAQAEDDKFYKNLCLLAQKSRAARIHLIISTQRPSAQNVNGNIKANFPARVCFKVSSHIESKIILDTMGGEVLNGNGDALLRDNTRNMLRFQSAYISPTEVVSFFNQS